MGHTDGTTIAIAESEWKREIENASALFKWFPNDELDWMFYSGRQGIHSRTAIHVWDRYRTRRATEKSQIPYEQKLLETNPIKTMTKPQKKEEK